MTQAEQKKTEEKTDIGQFIQDHIINPIPSDIDNIDSKFTLIIYIVSIYKSYIWAILVSWLF